eukprot:9581549-Alexandrium_andersonii.AAC.1
MAAGAPQRPHARWKAWRSARLRRPTGPSGPLARRRAEWYASWKWPASTTTRHSWPSVGHHLLRREHEPNQGAHWLECSMLQTAR